tara:strand:- start:112 stop:597 length:486 start_codon:yes stop_codon:yes gene_type:complete
MKRIIYFTIISTLLYGCNVENTNPEKSFNEVSNFIASQFDFFTNSSLEQAKNTFSADAVLIGTDEAEYLSGWSEIEPSIVGQLAIKNPKFETRDLNIVISDNGDMASYTQLLDFTFTVGEDSGEINNVRNSGVVKKVNGEWKVVQIHWSIGVQGQAVEYDY